MTGPAVPFRFEYKLVRYEEYALILQCQSTGAVSAGTAAAFSPATSSAYACLFINAFWCRLYESLYAV